MTGMIDWLTDQLATNPLSVALIVGLLSMAEAVIIVGTFVPGVTIVLAIAAAAGAAGEGLWPVFLAVAIGTISGDLISYWVGRRYGMKIAGWGPLARRPHVFAKSEAFFEKRGFMSVAIARFLPAVRTLVPTFAGIAKMSPVTFTVANGLSGIVWAALHVFGVGLAASALAEIGGRLAAVMIGALIVLGIAIWLARIATIFSIGVIRRVRNKVHRWASRRSDRASRVLARTLSPEDTSGLLIIFWTSLLIAGVVAFAGLLEAVWSGKNIITIDLAFSRFVQSLRTPSLDDAMVIITSFGDAIVLASVVIAIIGFLLFYRHFWIAGTFVLGILSPLLFVPLVKGMLARARPLTDLYDGVDSFSFPSGHTTNSAVVLGLLAVLLAGSVRGRMRWVMATLLLMPVLLIAFSRIYLQAHWPSDVVAGLAFAAAVTAGFALSLSVLPDHEVRPWRLGAVVLATFAVVGGLNIGTGFEADKAAYAPHTLTEQLTLAQWEQQGWQVIGPGRIDFEGDVESPFHAQWLGDRTALDAALLADGWRKAEPWDLTAVTALFRGRSSLDELPPVPRLHLGRLPVETFVKDGDADRRLVFRLWPSRYNVGGKSLSVGALEAEVLEHSFGMTTFLDDRRATPDEVSAIIATVMDGAESGGDAAIVRMGRSDAAADD
ncbi:VTT domain-containing protein [Acuticoccus sp. MNP-M23]|uniref:bifunctional DedA family/phosphatase PAP2 family protein n=1 Tax=Acuticoccus sp. MNP-M23 TaxID=3072793 RepID=UPI002814C949|nr:VTT domain-containing protein [Acuticoccus sp. MNP-M23]WMS42366.1 VTT domain-containing protein [Acuticoccus sp. MNP-M23]